METEEIKKEFLRIYTNIGDLSAFEFLDKAITCNNNIDIETSKELMEILPILYKVNYLEIEFENGAYNKKVKNLLEKSNITDFYINLKSILLFDILKFEQEDFQ